MSTTATLTLIQFKNFFFSGVAVVMTLCLFMGHQWIFKYNEVEDEIFQRSFLLDLSYYPPTHYPTR